METQGDPIEDMRELSWWILRQILPAAFVSYLQYEPIIIGGNDD